jgi:hypothetical protein
MATIVAKFAKLFVCEAPAIELCEGEEIVASPPISPPSSALFAPLSSMPDFFSRKASIFIISFSVVRPSASSITFE